MANYKLVNPTFNTFDLMIDSQIVMTSITHDEARQYAQQHVKPNDTWDESALGLWKVSGQELLDAITIIKARRDRLYLD